ncbi:hypothetical protein D3C73_1428360 [compost metagenome]
MPPPILLRRATSVLESKIPSNESSTVSIKQLESCPATFFPALDIVGVAAVMYMLLIAQYASLTSSIRLSAGSWCIRYIAMIM